MGLEGNLVIPIELNIKLTSVSDFLDFWFTRSVFNLTISFIRLAIDGSVFFSDLIDLISGSGFFLARDFLNSFDSLLSFSLEN